MPLIDLDAAKDYLNLSADNTDDDAEIQGWIDAVTVLVENEVGPCTVREFTSTVSGTGSWWLPRRPVVEITEITAFGHTSTTDVEDYVVQAATGRVVATDGYGVPAGDWTITYTAGWDEVPVNIQRAALMILKHLWTNQRAAGAGRGRFDAESDQPMGAPWAVPKAAMDLLKPHRRLRGIA